MNKFLESAPNWVAFEMLDFMRILAVESAGVLPLFSAFVTEKEALYLPIGISKLNATLSIVLSKQSS